MDPKESRTKYHYDLSRLRKPAAVLRYAAVREIIEDYGRNHSVTKICEFGCANMNFMENIVHDRTNIKAEKIILVDIDKEQLVQSSYKLHPHANDNFRKAEAPLKLTVCKGSIAAPNKHLRDIDIVVAIELIEHLYPNVLEGVPYNIFGYMQPKLVVMTTPNVEYNVMFKDLKGFRHWDHKFEWTRQQFQDWASNIVDRFPDYTVKFRNVGDDFSEAHGSVSQLALFTRKCEDESFGICSYSALQPDLNTNEVIEQIVYPCISREEQILRKILEYIDLCLNKDCNFFNKFTGKLEVPLSELVADFNSRKYLLRGKPLVTTETEARKLIDATIYKIEDIFKKGAVVPSFVTYGIKELPPKVSRSKNYRSKKCRTKERV